MPQSLCVLKSAEIFEKVKTLPAYTKAKTVMFYLSFDGEVITDNMIKSALNSGKEIAVPAIKNKSKKEMGVFKITSLNLLCNAAMGIREPKIEKSKEIDKKEIDLIFVPGIVFDLKRFRIGYGGGFFDRWLEEVPQEKTAGLCYDFQIAAQIPREKFDAQLGMIISEKRFLYEKLLKRRLV